MEWAFVLLPFFTDTTTPSPRTTNHFSFNCHSGIQFCTANAPFGSDFLHKHCDKRLYSFAGEDPILVHKIYVALSYILLARAVPVSMFLYFLSWTDLLSRLERIESKYLRQLSRTQNGKVNPIPHDTFTSIANLQFFILILRGKAGTELEFERLLFKIPAGYPDWFETYFKHYEKIPALVFAQHILENHFLSFDLVCRTLVRNCPDKTWQGTALWGRKRPCDITLQMDLWKIFLLFPAVLANQLVFVRIILQKGIIRQGHQRNRTDTLQLDSNTRWKTKKNRCRQCMTKNYHRFSR